MARERDTARTRRTVLDAAARAVAKHGAGVSVDAIAKAAGVSKGGLLHHFASRDGLLLALAEDLFHRFRDEVAAAADPADHAPGRLVRAYVKVTFDAIAADPDDVEHLLIIAALKAVPGVPELMRADHLHWKAAFTADGLHPQRVIVITRATDGEGVAGLYEGGYDPDRLRATRELLLALSRQAGPLVSPTAPAAAASEPPPARRPAPTP